MKFGDKAIFKVGDRVKWRSQAQGSFTTKHGVIAAVVPGGVMPDKVCEWFVAETTIPRKGVSYLVDIGKRSVRLRWPRTKHLEAV